MSGIDSHLRKGTSRFYASLAALIVIMFACGQGFAITTTWNQLVDGDFLDAGNWDNGLPGEPDSANFNNNFTGTVEFSSSYKTQDLFLQNTSGTITFDVDPDDNGNVYEATRFLIVGAGAGNTNNYVQVSGEVVTGIFFIGNAEGATGNTAVVDGAGTILRGTGGASGTVADIRVGSNGGDDSSLTVSGGASVISSTTTIIGLQGANNGQLTVTGAGTSFETGSLQLGDNTTPLGPQTNNDVDVLAGATMTAGRFIVGVTSPSPNNTLTVDGAGTTLNLTGGASDIGRASTGNSFLVQNGAAVTGAASFVIGRDEFSSGNLMSVGSSTTVGGSSIEVLRGTLLIDGGDVDLTEVFDEDPLVNAFVSGELIADSTGSDAQVDLYGGSLSLVEASVSNGSALAVGDGAGDSFTYRMKPSQNGGNGVHTFADGLFLNSDGVLAGSGDIEGNVSGAAGSIVDIGTSPGQINVTGDFDSTGVTIQTGLEDLSASLDAGVGFDQLMVNGAFTHGGSVQIDLAALVSPASPASVKVVGWTSQIGSSASTTVSFVGGDALSYSFMPDGLFVDVPAGGILQGDLNGDGFVGIADLNIVLGNWNQNVTPGSLPDGDPTGDGFVGIADLNEVLGNWNAGTPPNASVVPEPMTIASFVVTGLATCVRRRRV